MTDHNRITELIYSAIDEMNEGEHPDKQLGKSPETALYGKSSKLDSFGLVNLIVSVEERIQDETGLAVNLADEKALSQRNSPFLTVSTLTDYIMSLLGEKEASN